MVDLLIELLKAVWLLLPVYAANIAPNFIKTIHPIDMKKKFFDKKRILGDGKTVEGLLFGVFIGTISGIFLSYIEPQANSLFSTTLPHMTIFLAFMISLGSLVGDMGGSFIKRRMGLKRGDEIILLDQLDMVVGMLVFSYWFVEINIWVMIMMFVITPFLHRLACIIGYHIKVKREPW